MSDGMGREPAYLSSHATNRYFIPNWGNYYRLIVRFSPSCNVIDYCTTMASADFSRQALLRFFRKSNYLKRP